MPLLSVGQRIGAVALTLLETKVPPNERWRIICWSCKFSNHAWARARVAIGEPSESLIRLPAVSMPDGSAGSSTATWSGECFAEPSQTVKLEAYSNVAACDVIFGMSYEVVKV